MGRNSGISLDRLAHGADFGTMDIPVKSTGVAYSVPAKIGFGTSFAGRLKATSDGSVAVTVDIEVGDELPTNYNAADDNFVSYEGYSTPLIDIADEKEHKVSISPPPSKYLRYKLTGTGSNHSSTTMTAGLNKIQTD